VLRPNTYKHGTIGVLGSRNTQNDAVPAVVMAVEHYNMLVRMTQAGVAPTLRVEVGSRYHEEDTNGYNIIAEIPGTDPAVRDEVVLIGAHIDSWHASSGATDNADGSVGVMEAMRILKAVGAQPRRTIRVALWDAEEQGLLGSRAHVQQHYEGDANAAAREKFYVYFNADPGTGPIYGFYLEDNAAIAPIFDAWLAPLRDLGAKRNVLEGIGSTDHVTFNRAGLPGYNAINDYVDYDVRSRHTNTDFYERVREEDLKQSAIVLAVFAYHAAMREGPLPRVEPGQREP
jgi:Zn-dependent M28 family amino/carboxypeptidase